MGTHSSHGYYGPAVAYVQVETAHGEGIGSAFHIGDGVFVTAKHVVEGNTILSVATTLEAFVEQAGGFKRPGWNGEWAKLRIESRTPTRLELSDDSDVAAFTLDLPHSEFPELKLATLPPDWLTGELVLDTAYVLGYPPIPTSAHPILVGLRGEVCAIVPERCLGNKHLHLIVSSMARGGFSGGPVIHEYGTVLGLVTEAFVRNGLEPEFGYTAVVPADIIVSFLEGVGMMPVRNPWEEYGL